MVPAQRQSTTSPCKPQKSLSKHQFLLSKPPSIVPYWRQHHFPLISASISIDYSSQHVSISFPCRYFMSYSSSQQNLFSVCLHEFRRAKKPPPSIRIALSQLNHIMHCHQSLNLRHQGQEEVEWLDFAPCSEDCHEKAEEIEGGRSRLGRTLWFGSSQ